MPPSSGPPFVVAKIDSTTTPALVTAAYKNRPVYFSDQAIVMDPRKQGVSASEAQTFMARVTRAAGAFTGILFRVQISEDGANYDDPDAKNWDDLQIVNLKTSLKTTEHSISPGAGSFAVAHYGTQDLRNAPYHRTLVKATGGNAGAGDAAYIVLRAS